MKKKVFYSFNAKAIFIIDIMVIAVGLFLAWLIRSQFELFIYDLKKLLVLFPWVLITRMLANFFFSSYSFSSSSLYHSDFLRILFFNIPTSIILLAFRLFSKMEVLRMPLSIIFMEYVFSSFGFLLVRFLFQRGESRKGGNLAYIGYVRRVLLWGEVKEIEEAIGSVETFQMKHHVKIEGILNANPFYWDTEWENIRIFGDESKLLMLIKNNENISTLCIVNPYFITKKRLYSINREIESLNMVYGIAQREDFQIVSFSELYNLTQND